MFVNLDTRVDTCTLVKCILWNFIPLDLIVFIYCTYKHPVVDSFTALHTCRICFHFIVLYIPYINNVTNERTVNLPFYVSPILDSTDHLRQTPVKQVILLVEPVRTEIIKYSVYCKPKNKCNRIPAGSHGY